MNKLIKLNIAALALVGSGLCATSVQAADSLNGFYTSVRIGIQHKNPGDGASSSTAIESFASRIGYKSEAHLFNGLTGFGRLEFQIDAEDSKADENGVRDTAKMRLGFVGIKGDFGKLLIGQAYHTFYQFAAGPTDNPWWNSNASLLSGGGRTGDGLTYEKSLGDFRIGATTYLDNDSDNEGTEIGLSAKLGPVNLGFGRRDLDSFTDPINGIVLNGKLGPVAATISLQEQGDADSSQLTLRYSNFYLQTGDKGDAKKTTLGYTHKLGKKTLMWFEFFNDDSGDGSDADKTLIATLKYDIF